MTPNDSHMINIQAGYCPSGAIDTLCYWHIPTAHSMISNL